MADHFPNDIVLIPSVSYSGFFLTQGFVDDMMKDAQKRFERGMAKPWLIGISAGGHGSLNLYTKHPGRYKGALALACDFTDDAAKRLHPNMRIGWLLGTNEQALKKAPMERKLAFVRRRVRKVDFAWIEGDHFFLATNPEKTATRIKRVLERP